MSAAPAAVSVFDLDRTLTRHGTYLPFLLYAAARLRPWRLATLPAVVAAMAGYKLRLLDRTRLKELMQRLLLGPSLDAAVADGVARRYAARMLSHGVLPQARVRIDAERAAGRTVVIATAALELYARPLAEGLNVERLVATRSVRDGGRLLARIEGANCHGPGKLARVEAHLAASGLERAHLRFFSDDASDLPMFARCAEPIAVNPTRALRRLARARGWPVLEWRDR